MYEAVEFPSVHWLELVTSFNLTNTRDNQFDMPITKRAFIFHCFDSIVDIPSHDVKVDKALIDFYLTYGKPQYVTWSVHKLTTV